MSVINDFPGASLPGAELHVANQIEHDDWIRFCEAERPWYNTLKGEQGEVAYTGIAPRPWQKHHGEPLLYTINWLGSFRFMTEHTGPMALCPVGRLLQWLNPLDTFEKKKK